MTTSALMVRFAKLADALDAIGRRDLAMDVDALRKDVEKLLPNSEPQQERTNA